jgi:hypothetical protein
MAASVFPCFSNTICSAAVALAGLSDEGHIFYDTVLPAGAWLQWTERSRADIPEYRILRLFSVNDMGSQGRKIPELSNTVPMFAASASTYRRCFYKQCRYAIGETFNDPGNSFPAFNGSECLPVQQFHPDNRLRL